MELSKKTLFVAWVVVLVCLMGLSTAGPVEAKSKINKSFFGGVAMEGYDPVAYFTAGRPIEGRKEFTVKWMEATWRFSSAENKALFEQDPAKYAPQYGGYCAWAVAQGHTAGIDPQAWKIVEGKLYLNYNLEIQKKWEADIPGNIKKADANWPGVLD